MQAREKEAGKHPLFDCDCESLFFPTTVEDIKKNILHHVMSFQGRDPQRAGEGDIYKAVAYTLRDIMVEKWIATQKASYAKGKKRVYYLSLEFLIGRSMGNSLINLGIYDAVQQAVEELGFDMDILREEEEDAGLLAMGAWGVWRPVSWIPSPPSRFRPMGTVSSMNMGCFISS